MAFASDNRETIELFDIYSQLPCITFHSTNFYIIEYSTCKYNFSIINNLNNSIKDYYTKFFLNSKIFSLETFLLYPILYIDSENFKDSKECLYSDFNKSD